MTRRKGTIAPVDVLAQATVAEIATGVGTARVTILHASGRRRGSLVLGHGAGGGSWSADLMALATQVPEDGWAVVLVEQPWRVAGKRVASRPPVLDAAWTDVIAGLRSGACAGGFRMEGALVSGGRSAGARVACRTAAAIEADAVLALAFPLHPPGKPQSSRADELLDAAGQGIPLLVVQGASDTFGRPGEVAQAVGEAALSLVTVAGGHGFSANPGDVVAAVRGWLPSLARRGKPRRT